MKDNQNIESNQLRASSRKSLLASDHKVAFWLTILVGSSTLLFHGSVIGSSDGMSTYEVAKSIIEDGDVAITRGVVWKGRDGRHYSPYGLGLSVVAIIPYVLVRPISQMTPEPEAVRQAGVAVLMPIIVGLVAAALYRLSRRLGARPQASLIVALGAVAGTFLFVYSKDFFSEPPAAVFLIVSIEQAIARRPGSSAAALAAAALTRPQCFAFAPILLWRLRCDGGWRAVCRGILPLVMSLLICLGYNFVRFGNVLNFGYSNAELPQGFTTPFLDGASGLLFHPQKSILIFAPISLLLPFALKRLWNSDRTAFWLLTGNLAITFAIAATWWAWGGGWVWGPRLLIPGLIPAIAALGAWSEKVARPVYSLMAALLVLGFFVSAPAILVGVGAQLKDEPLPPLGPSVVRQVQLVPGAISYTIHHLYEQDPSWREAASRIGTWQFRVTRVLGRRGLPVAVLGSLALALGILLSGLRLQRILRADADVFPIGQGES